MTPLVFEYDLSREEHAAGVSAAFTQTWARDPFRTKFIVAYAILLFAMSMLWDVLRWSQWTLFAAVIIGLGGVQLINKFFHRQSADASFDTEEASSIRLEIGDDGLHERTRNRERRYQWSGVHEIVEMGDTVAFRLAAHDVIVLPRRLLNGDTRRRLSEGLAEVDRHIDLIANADGRASAILPEVVLVAKLAVSTAILSLGHWFIFSRIAVNDVPPQSLVGLVLGAIAASVVGAVVGWKVVGRWLAAVGQRSPARGRQLAYGMIVLSFIIIAFVFYPFW